MNGSNFVPEKDLRAIITQDTNEAIKSLDQTAEKIGRELSGKITTSQIRNVFGTVRMIQQDLKHERKDGAPIPSGVQRSLMMLKPKLAYQYGRNKNNAMGTMTSILTQSIDLVLETESPAAFDRFVDFFEAILAYHRYHGGRTN